MKRDYLTDYLTGMRHGAAPCGMVVRLDGDMASDVQHGATDTDALRRSAVPEAWMTRRRSGVRFPHGPPKPRPLTCGSLRRSAAFSGTTPVPEPLRHAGTGGSMTGARLVFAG